jgi:hypothetical protein
VTLNEIRKLAIKGRQRVQFPLSSGQTCLITEHGIAKVPGLDGPPRFNLETELGSATEFTLEAVAGPKERPQPVRMSRQELAAKLAIMGGGGTAVHDDHEE